LGIIDISGLIMTTNVNILDTNDSWNIISELAPMEKKLFRLQDVMQEITNECKGGGVQLCDHATLLLKIVASNIQNIQLIWAKYTEEWSFTMWMMARAIQLIEWKIGMNPCSSIQTLVFKKRLWVDNVQNIEDLYMDIHYSYIDIIV
jgi:hypothetical protein